MTDIPGLERQMKSMNAALGSHLHRKSKQGLLESELLSGTPFETSKTAESGIWVV